MSKLIDQLPEAVSLSPDDYLVINQGNPPITRLAKYRLFAAAQVLAVQFTDESSPTPSSWTWDFGDGGTSTEQHPLHTYAAVGEYDVILEAVINGTPYSLMEPGYIITTAA